MMELRPSVGMYRTKLYWRGHQFHLLQKTRQRCPAQGYKTMTRGDWTPVFLRLAWCTVSEVFFCRCWRKGLQLRVSKYVKTGCSQVYIDNWEFIGNMNVFIDPPPPQHCNCVKRPQLRGILFVFHLITRMHVIVEWRYGANGSPDHTTL